jgi:peptide chain release factor 2
VAAAARLASELSEATDLLAMAREEDEESVEAECLATLAAVQAEADELYTEALMGAAAYEGSAACYLEIVAGAGGADACDWVAMLRRMYGGFAARRGGRSTPLEEQPGAGGVGLRSATLRLDGVPRAYGWLQHEAGVHRLVRKSPFDGSGKRHTSFAHVAVFNASDDDGTDGGGSKHGGGSSKAPLLPASEVSIDTFRSQGAGGQHVNTTDSAVRATHLPTGLTAACQAERSQHRNKASALQLLAAKVAKRAAEARAVRRLSVLSPFFLSLSRFLLLLSLYSTPSRVSTSTRGACSPRRSWRWRGAARWT